MWNAGVLDEFAHHIGGHVWTSGESSGGLHGHRFQRKQTRARLLPARWHAEGLLPHTGAAVSSEATGAVLRESDFARQYDCARPETYETLRTNSPGVMPTDPLK